MTARQALLCFCLVAITGISASAPCQATRWKSPDGKYSITPPKGWTYKKSPNGSVAAMFLMPRESASDIFQENFNVVMEPGGGRMTTDAYFDACAKALSGAGLQGYKEIGRGSATLGNIKAKTITYKLTISGIVMTARAFVFTGNGNGWVITTGAQEGKFSKMEKTFADIAASFRYGR